MQFLGKLHKNLEEWNLLGHSFYKKWNEGKVSKDTLKIYAKEYYAHVAAFPRYISTIHSLSTDIQTRQILLENLIDEERGSENHPDLWLRFAKALGCSEQECENHKLNSTKKLVDGYFEITRSSFAAGLGALYAYERQTPEVAKSKMEGLKTFYNIKNEESLKFFSVHMVADEWHTAECADLLLKLSPKEQEEAHKAAIAGAKLLWGFLDEMEEINNNALST